MSILAATESDVAATAGADPDATGPRAPRRTRLLSDRTLARARWAAIATWAVAMLYWINRVGLTFDRNTLIIYICTGLLAASIGRRGVLSVARDWLPFGAVLVAYDLSRGAADALGRPTEWRFQLDFDRWLFGADPAVWLQARLKEPFPPWWETGVSLIYVSYFLAPPVVAGLLWLRDRVAWRRFAAQFVAISVIGLAGFIAFPAAPPWAASQCTAQDVAGGPSDPPCVNAEVGTLTTGGLLEPMSTHQGGAAPYVERIATRGWNKLGIPQAKALIDEGQAGSNQVAAVPSLHAALSALLSVFFWPRVRRRWRPLLALYALGMGFALVYSAEHYVFDILLGWLVTAVVTLGFARWQRRRRPGSTRAQAGSTRAQAGSDRAQAGSDRAQAQDPAGAGEKPLAATDTLNGSSPSRS